MIKISKEELEDLYLNQKLTTAEIGKLHGRGREAIRQRLIKFGIERRSPKECHEGYKPTAETLRKQSEGLQREKHPLWGKHHSKKTKKKMRESHIGQFKGENHPNWRGGQFIDVQGYVHVLVPEHPQADSKGYIRRSHLVAEEMLGRYLYSDEVTHHKNGIRDDDRPENIEVLTRGEHQSFHNRNKEKYREINYG